MAAKFKLELKETKSKAKNMKLDLALLKSNLTLREKYRVAVQNKYEVSGEIEEVDQQWMKFKAEIARNFY